MFCVCARVALVRGRGGQPHRRGADDLPAVAQCHGSPEHDVQLLPVGGVARPRERLVRQGHPLPRLQRRGDVLWQQPLHPRPRGRVCGKSKRICATVITIVTLYWYLVHPRPPGRVGYTSPNLDRRKKMVTLYFFVHVTIHWSRVSLLLLHTRLACSAFLLN